MLGRGGRVVSERMGTLRAWGVVSRLESGGVGVSGGVVDWLSPATSWVGHVRAVSVGAGLRSRRRGEMGCRRWVVPDGGDVGLGALDDGRDVLRPHVG